MYIGECITALAASAWIGALTRAKLLHSPQALGLGPGVRDTHTHTHTHIHTHTHTLHNSDNTRVLSSYIRMYPAYIRTYVYDACVHTDI